MAPVSLQSRKAMLERHGYRFELQICQMGMWVLAERPAPSLGSPQQPFALLPFSVEWLKSFRSLLMNPRPPPPHSRGYFNQKPVQAKLAIIQQNNEFYPDSFIPFLKCW